MAMIGPTTTYIANVLDTDTVFWPRALSKRHAIDIACSACTSTRCSRAHRHDAQVRVRRRAHVRGEEHQVGVADDLDDVLDLEAAAGQLTQQRRNADAVAVTHAHAHV